MVTQMDDAIGQVMDLVKELGIDGETLVIFTSDNGPTYNRLGGSDSDFFRSAGVFRGLKGSLYEGGIRVPMVARWPGKIEAGSTSEHISAFWDWLPTLADVAGADVPEGLDGLSLLPAMTGGEQQAHEFLYWEFPGYGGQQVVRLGDWKGVRQGVRRAKTTADLKTELYNLKSDPGEKTDVAADNPGIVARIEAIMQREHVPSPLFPLLPGERGSR